MNNYNNELPLTYKTKITNQQELFNFLEDEEIKSQITSFLESYYSSDRGEVHDFNFNIECSIQNGLEWKITVIYDVLYFNGCKHLDSRDEDKTMILTITQNNCDIIIEGDINPTREPDEI